MEPNADPVDEANHGNGYTCCNGVLTRSCYGFTLAFVGITVEGWGNVFTVPLRETPKKAVRTLGLVTVPGSLAVAMVLSEDSEYHAYLFFYFPEISQLLLSSEQGWFL